MSLLLIDWNALSAEAVNIIKTVGLNILQCIGVFILGFIVIKLLVKLLRKIFSKTKMPSVTAKFLVTVIKFSLYMLLLIAICQIIGIPITGFIAVISAAGLALSLAMQDSLSNLANGVVIISTRPFNEGDYIKIDDVEGTVKEINMLHTIITTTDNKTISIPNSTVVGSELINYSHNKTRKVVFSFSIDYASDVEKAKQVILSVMTSCNKVLLTPAPFCALEKLGDSSISIYSNCWCYGEDYWDVYYYVMENVFNEFKRENIQMPYNQLEVRLRNDQVVLPFNEKPLAKRDEKVAVKPLEEHQPDAFEKFVKTYKQKRKEKKEKHKEEKAKKQKKDKTKKQNTEVWQLMVFNI